LRGQDTGFRIHGEIQVQKAEGTIHINVVEKKHLDIPQSGLDTILLKICSNSVKYEFRGIPEGTYGIRCFQDLNGNGKLDRGMFGPSEPWAMSWKEKIRFPPRFEDISFTLQGDKQLDLKLTK